MVLQSIKSVFALMTLILIGFYFSGKKWFGKPGMDFLSRFTVEATIPFYMFYNIYKDIGSRDALFSMVSRLPAGKKRPPQYIYSCCRLSQCGIHRISGDSGALGRRNYFDRRGLLYFQHGPVLDDRRLAVTERQQAGGRQGRFFR